MNLHQRLTKLEERTPERQTAVVWVNPGDTPGDTLRRIPLHKYQRVLFVTWQT